MKKFLKYGAGGLALLLLLLFGGFYVWGEISLATPTDAALLAMQSDERVTVDEGRFISFRPTTGEPRLGVIFYPGANCDSRGYAPVFRRVASRGYLVVDVPMPRNFAIFAPDRFLGIEERAFVFRNPRPLRDLPGGKEAKAGH